MESKNKVIESMEKLNAELEKSHKDSELAIYVSQVLKELKKSDGVAFTGVLQYFYNRAPIVRISDNVKFSTNEEALWNEVFSFVQLGNNLWGASY